MARKTEKNQTRRQRKPLNREAVDRLLRTVDAIERAHPGLMFEDSAETLRQIREERMWELEHNGGILSKEN